jgi:type I site-specific restriction endonuclease
VELPPLNLPHAEFRVREDGNERQIFDAIRKRFVALTPEEWVRQNFLNFLVNERKYPASLIGVEMLVRLNEMSQRADIVVYQRNGKPWLIVECKAPTVTLDEDVFYQAARYNSQLRVPYIALTNGLEHYCLFFNGKSFDYLADLPDFNTKTD